MAGVKKLARERAKKANLHNKKLRDCRVHYNDIKKGKVSNYPIYYGGRFRIWFDHKGKRREHSSCF